MFEYKGSKRMKREVLKPGLRPAWFLGLLVGAWLALSSAFSVTLLYLTEPEPFVQAAEVKPSMSEEALYINSRFYSGGETQFRDLEFRDGNVDVLTVGNVPIGSSGNLVDSPISIAGNLVDSSISIAMYAHASGAAQNWACWYEGDTKVNNGRFLVGEIDVGETLEGLLQRVRKLEGGGR